MARAEDIERVARAFMDDHIEHGFTLGRIEEQECRRLAVLAIETLALRR